VAKEELGEEELGEEELGEEKHIESNLNTKIQIY